MKKFIVQKVINIGDGQHRIIDIEAKDEKDAVKKAMKIGNFRKNKLLNVNVSEETLKVEGPIQDFSPAFVKKLLGKLDQVTHPRLYDHIVKDYVKALRTGNYEGTPVTTKGKLIVDIIRQFMPRDQPRVNSVVDYINKLVRKGTLPKELNGTRLMKEKQNKTQI